MESKGSGKNVHISNDIYEGWDPEQRQLEFQNEEFAASSEKSVLKEFFVPFAKQLYRAGLKGIELYRFSVPIFILQPVSVLESMSMHSSPTQFLFDTLGDAQSTPEQRMLAIVSWIVYDHRTIFRFGLTAIKPYNSVLGEQFFCEWRQGDDITSYMSEQVSHHPPVSAFHMENRARGFVFYGAIYPKVSMGIRSFTTNLIGNEVIELQKFGELYSVTLPSVKTSNVLFSFGSPKICHVHGTLVVKEKINGRYRAEINFDLKDKKNHIDGGVYFGDQKIFRLHGVMTGKVVATDLRTGESRTVYDLVSDKSVEYGRRVVAPVGDRNENESRRVWHVVTEAILKGDMDGAAKGKHAIESLERRRRGEGDKRDFKPELFEQDPSGRWRMKMGRSSKGKIREPMH